MIEIIVGLIALVVSYHIFPRGNSSNDSQDTILPFLDEEFLNDNKKPKGEYYDWADDMKDDCDLPGENDFDDPGDEYFEDEPFQND